MSGREFIPKLPPRDRPGRGSNAWTPVFVFGDNLKPHTRILIGVWAQIILSALVPMRWAVVPAGIFLLNSIITTILQTYSKDDNPFLEDVVYGRATSQIPFADGTHGNRSASSDVVVFQLGIQFNHPLGALCPGGRDVSMYFLAMEDELKKKREEYGVLSMSLWRGDERGSNNTLLYTFYFDNVENLHRFAHGDVHRKGWDWHNKDKFKHIGIFHETFCVPAKSYETVYVNTRPVLMGRGLVKTKSDSGEGWSSTLVSADMPALKTQYARLSRHENGQPME